MIENDPSDWAPRPLRTAPETQAFGGRRAALDAGERGLREPLQHLHNVPAGARARASAEGKKLTYDPGAAARPENKHEVDDEGSPRHPEARKGGICARGYC